MKPSKSDNLFFNFEKIVRYGTKITLLFKY